MVIKTLGDHMTVIQTKVRWTTTNYHPLLSDVVGDNDYDTNSKPGNSETESDSQHDSDAAKVPDAIPSTSLHLLLS